MKKKLRVMLPVVFVLMLIAIVIGINMWNNKKLNTDVKNFTITVESDTKVDRQETSNCKTLGEFIRTTDYCSWEDSSYGTYIKGFDGLMEDSSSGYYWFVYINGETATTGVDQIVLEDGYEYSFIYTPTK